MHAYIEGRGLEMRKKMQIKELAENQNGVHRNRSAKRRNQRTWVTL